MEVQLSDEGRGDRIQNSELTYGREGERRNLPKDLKHRAQRLANLSFTRPSRNFPPKFSHRV